MFFAVNIGLTFEQAAWWPRFTTDTCCNWKQYLEKTTPSLSTSFLVFLNWINLKPMVSNTQYFWFKYAMSQRYLVTSLNNLRFAAPVWRIFSSTKNTGPGMTLLKTDQKLWGVLNLGFWKFLAKNYGILPSWALKTPASRHPRIPKVQHQDATTVPWFSTSRLCGALGARC